MRLANDKETSSGQYLPHLAPPPPTVSDVAIVQCRKKQGFECWRPFHDAKLLFFNTATCSLEECADIWLIEINDEALEEDRYYLARRHGEKFDRFVWSTAASSPGGDMYIDMDRDYDWIDIDIWVWRIIINPRRSGLFIGGFFLPRPYKDKVQIVNTGPYPVEVKKEYPGASAEKRVRTAMGSFTLHPYQSCVIEYLPGTSRSTASSSGGGTSTPENSASTSASGSQSIAPNPTDAAGNPIADPNELPANKTQSASVAGGSAHDGPRWQIGHAGSSSIQPVDGVPTQEMPAGATAFDTTTGTIYIQTTSPSGTTWVATGGSLSSPFDGRGIEEREITTDVNDYPLPADGVAVLRVLNDTFPVWDWRIFSFEAGVEGQAFILQNSPCSEGNIVIPHDSADPPGDTGTKVYVPCNAAYTLEPGAGLILVYHITPCGTYWVPIDNVAGGKRLAGSGTPPTESTPVPGVEYYDIDTDTTYIYSGVENDWIEEPCCYTDEQAQDAAAAMILASDSIEATYNDATNELSFALIIDGSATPGQIVTVNGGGTGLESVTLTAGSGIALTPGSGTLEIAVSGSFAITVEASTGTPSVVAVQITVLSQHLVVADAGSGEATVRVKRHGAFSALAARSFV